MCGRDLGRGSFMCANKLCVLSAMPRYEAFLR